VIADLKPYPTYKNSGVPWLGEVPEHWGIERLKSSMNNVIQQTVERQGTDLYVALEHVESWTGRLRQPVSDVPFDSQVKRFQSGDVLFGKLRPYLAKVTRPASGGVCVGEFFVLHPRTSNFTGPYIEQLLRSKPTIDAINSSTFGAKMPRADWQFVGAMAVTLPPLLEQAAIVRFLDHVDRRIKHYISAKQKLIKLLEEQKQAIIHRAVTRGLDPNVRLKPSGVEWLGDVPEHWKLVRLKDVAVVQTGLTLGKNYKGVQTESRPYLRVANVQVGRLDLKHVKYIEVPTNEANGATLRAGDVLMTEGGDIDKLERGCVWRDEIPGCLHQNHIFAVRCRKDILVPEFLVGLMGSRHGRAYFQLTAKQTTNLASTNSSILRAFPVFLPPLVEQQSILGAIATQTAGLAAAIGRAEGEIELLREYRTRLIADVVTGKLDVREAAATLPDETVGDEAVNDDAVPTEDEEDVENEGLDAVPEEAEA